MIANWNELMEEHEIAYLRGDLATSSPESYTVEEMKNISNDMFESTVKIDSALRADFASMPPQLQGRMLELLCAEDPEMEAWWRNLLVDEMPSCPGELAASK